MVGFGLAGHAATGNHGGGFFSVTALFLSKLKLGESGVKPILDHQFIVLALF